MANIFVKVWHGIEDIPALLDRLIKGVPRLLKGGDDLVEDVPMLVPQISVIVGDLGDIVVTSAQDADTVLPLLGKLVAVLAVAVAARGTNVLDDADVLMAVKNIAGKASAFTNVVPKIEKLLVDGSTLLSTIKTDLAQVEHDLTTSGSAPMPAPQISAVLTEEEGTNANEQA